MNPYTQAVVNPTVQALQQQQGQQLSQQQSEAIRGGAFGGERSGLQRAQLQGQQNLAFGQAIAPLYQQGYQQAQNVAQQQQGVGLAAQQANLARLTQAGQQFAGLGTGAQTAAMQGAQGQIAAGTVEQQTKQADLTANYQQFLQQRGYDFQTAQFLANIAMGTGALSGSTTSTTQPSPFFSDERLKHDKKKIGETDDGLPIYSFKYNGDDRTQIGLMAQDVEKKKPEAVGLAPASDGHMYKTVDYDKATRPKKEYGGGLMPLDNSMGGAVNPDSTGESFARGGFALGGPSILSPTDQNALMASNYQTDAMPFSDQGMHGLPRGAMPGPQGIVPVSKGVHVPNLVTATPVGTAPTGLGDQALRAVNTGKQLAEGYGTVKTGLLGSAATTADAKGARGLIGSQGDLNFDKSFLGSVFGNSQKAASGGLIVPRHAYATDGGVDNDGHKVVIPGDPDHPGIPLDAGEAARKLAVSQANLGGDKSGTGDNLLKAANLAKTGVDLGTAAFKYLPMIFAADGGAIDRKGYAGDDGESGAVVEPGLAPANDVAASNAGSDYRSMVENAAKKNGIDVDHAVRLAHGESRLRPIVGDDGSSAGLFQLHVGGLSKQYPHPGLGDEYFKQRQPDLANKLSPSEKIAFLNAPENQADTADFATGHIAKNGAGAWTIARQQGLFGLPGEAPSRGLDVSSMLPTLGRSGPGLYSGKPASDATLGDVAGEFLPKSVPTSSNFWVPALSGIGSMLASKSHTLAGAIGEGLVGGVSGYQQQQKQQQDMVRNVFDMVKNRFTRTLDKNGNVVFIDTFNGATLNPGQVQQTVSKMLSSAGIDPEPYGMSRVQTADASRVAAPAGIRQVSDAGTGATVGPQDKPTKVSEASSSSNTSPATTPAPNADKPQQNINLMNPGQLRELVISGQISGGPTDARARQAEIDAMLKRADQLGGDIDPTISGQGIKLRELAATQQRLLDDKINQVLEYQKTQNNEFAKGRVDRINEYQKEVQTRTPTYDGAISNLQRLAKLASEQPTGRGSQLAADAVGLLKRAGLEDFIPSNWKNIPGGYDEIMKISTAQMLNQLMADKIIRAPQAGLKYEQATVPSPSSDPDAFYSLVGNKLGEVLHSRAKDTAFLNSPAGSIEPATHELTWPHQKGNELEAHKREAFSQLPINKSVSREQVKSLQDSYRDKETGATFTARYVGEPGAANEVAAPSLPAPLRSVEGLEYSASRNQYRDRAGNVYDASGKRVQ